VQYLQAGAFLEWLRSADDEEDEDEDDDEDDE
jgi:hypothetical protein